MPISGSSSEKTFISRSALATDDSLALLLPGRGFGLEPELELGLDLRSICENSVPLYRTKYN
ncbi:MAG: hypothetical protein WBM28_11810, partial [Burkholderiales bacterium]